MPVKPHHHPHPHGGAGGRPSCRGVAWEEARRIAVAAARALIVGNAPPPHSPDVPIGGAPVQGPAAGGRSVPGAPVVVPLVEALGCRLALPLRASVAVPGADVAAMDGYAVGGEPPWRVVGRVLAGGRPYGCPLRAGEAVEIATGAPVPDGTSAVLRHEDALVRPGAPTCASPSAPGPASSPDPGRDGWAGERGGAPSPEWVWGRGPLEAGRHVRRRGEDVAEGAVVLEAGVAVTPVVLALAAGLGHDTLPVRPRPAVSVLVTGDEVVHEGVPGPGRVRDAIGPFLPGLVEWAGGRVVASDHLPDGPEPLLRALSPPARLEPPRPGRTAPPSPPSHVGRADPRLPPPPPWARAGAVRVVVVCGASSKGPADHLRAVLDRLGAEVLVDGVAVRPGHPQLLARLRCGTLVVGLPGNPYAALGAALTLLVPILRTLTGATRAGSTGTLAAAVRPHPEDTRLLAVRRRGDQAVPVGHDRPGSLWGAALADALAVVPPGWRGEPVELIELPGRG
ncbi:molybdopterin molybdotransferase MoeA [Nonomuraea muscovyensis]